MFSLVFTVMAPVIVSVAIGFYWRKQQYDFCMETISRLVMSIGAPALILSSMVKVRLSWHDLAIMVLATLMVVIITSGVTIGLLKWAQRDLRTFFNSGVFVNTGNLGLPLCLLAFGDKGLALALIFFMTMSVLHFLPTRTLRSSSLMT